MQQMFNPTDYGFSWTEDWYEWDKKEALKARNNKLKLLKAQGLRATPFSLPKQLIRKGGIGTHHPDVEFIVTVYGINM